MKKLLLALLIASATCNNRAEIAQNSADMLAHETISNMLNAGKDQDFGCMMQSPLDYVRSIMMEKFYNISRSKIENVQEYEASLESAQQDTAGQATIAAALFAHRQTLDTMAEELQSMHEEMKEMYMNIWPSINDIASLSSAATEEATRCRFETARSCNLVDSSSSSESSERVYRGKYDVQSPETISSPEFSSMDEDRMRTVEAEAEQA